MHTQLSPKFRRKSDAKLALTNTRKALRIALRGAVVLGPDYCGDYTISADIGGTGYSAAELSAEIHARRDLS